MPAVPEKRDRRLLRKRPPSRDWLQAIPPHERFPSAFQYFMESHPPLSLHLSVFTLPFNISLFNTYITLLLP